MRAGLLREPLIVEDAVTEVSPSGATRKSWQEVFRTRCRRQKLTALVGDGVNAYEEFIQNTIVLQVRDNKRYRDTQRVVYNGQRFKVKLIDRKIGDSTLLLTCEKINE